MEWVRAGYGREVEERRRGMWKSGKERKVASAGEREVNLKEYPIRTLIRSLSFCHLSISSSTSMIFSCSCSFCSESSACEKRGVSWTGAEGGLLQRGAVLPLMHLALNNNSWEVQVPGTAWNGDHVLTLDKIPELLAGSRDSAPSAKTAAEAPTY